MKARNPALDVIRCVAFFCVVSIHFFLYSGFYDIPVTGVNMFIMVILRNSFMICVPLFIMLSGYLMRSKQLSIRYYLKLVHVLTIYVLASLCCMLFLDYIQGNTPSLFVAVFGILSFSHGDYAWYIEMYIGLFLMIPFLNTLYNGLATKSQKQLLLLTFLFLTALPYVVNVYRIGEAEWWIMPSINTDYRKLMPSWWAAPYPITYYFLGCYLNEYPFRTKTKTNLFAAVTITLIVGIYNIYRSRGSVFVSGPWQQYASLFLVIQSVSVFVLFHNIDYSRFTPFFAQIVQKISSLTLGAYLVSWIFDQIYYPILIQKVPVPEQRFLWFPVIVTAICASSLALSAILNGIDSIVFAPLLQFVSRKILTPHDAAK